MGCRLTTKEFIQKAEQIHNKKYNYNLTNYKGAKGKIKIICPFHGIFEQIAGNHLFGQGCPKCGQTRANKKNTLTTEQFIKEANKAHNNKYDYSQTEYINATTKVKIICPVHGIFEQLPSNHLKGTNCPKCFGREKTIEQFIKEAKEIHGDKYDYSKSNYKDSRTKICIICSKHGEFWQSPHAHITSKCGCPKCKSSHGETKIRNFLVENNIIFEEQKKFTECKDKRSLPFDFYLPEKNLLIEYQGEQHYKKGCFTSKKEHDNLSLRKKHDEIKRNYCKKNKITEIEIKYNENIKEVLKEWI